MRRTVMFAAVGLIVVACAGSAPTGTSAEAAVATTLADTAAPTSAPPATLVSTTAPAGDEAAATINISGSAFSGSVTISVGESVEVTNNDTLPHTWTSSNDVWDSGSLGTGDSFAFTFEEAGEFPFVCVIHPFMTGTVTVEG